MRKESRMISCRELFFSLRVNIFLIFCDSKECFVDQILVKPFKRPTIIVRRLDIVSVISAKSAYRKKTRAKAEWLICGMLDWVHLKWMKWNSEKCFEPWVSWEWCRVSPSLRFLQSIHSSTSMDECLLLLHSHYCNFVFLLPNNKGEPKLKDTITVLFISFSTVQT